MQMPPSAGPERRAINELSTRYELNPDISDVYVEGHIDKALVDWFLGEYHRTRWRVYPIDTVYVPTDLVSSHNLDIGERGEVIAFAMELHQRLEHVDCQKPICIADSDALYLLGETVDCPLCMLTDFTCLEMYLFNSRVLGKFLRLFTRTPRLDSATILNEMAPILTLLYVIRAVAHRWPVPFSVFANFYRCCSKRGATVELDARDLISRSLQPLPAGERPTVDEVLSQVEQLLPRVPSDPRFAIRGRDFVLLLAWYLEGNGVGIDFRKPDVVQRSLFTCVDLDVLGDYPLWRKLLERTA